VLRSPEGVRTAASGLPPWLSRPPGLLQVAGSTRGRPSSAGPGTQWRSCTPANGST